MRLNPLDTLLDTRVHLKTHQRQIYGSDLKYEAKTEWPLLHRSRNQIGTPSQEPFRLTTLNAVPGHHTEPLSIISPALTEIDLFLNPDACRRRQFVSTLRAIYSSRKMSMDPRTGQMDLRRGPGLLGFPYRQ